MIRRWQLQEAKSKLSEVVDEALSRGPQVITRRGEDAVVVLSYAEFQKMRLAQKPLSVFFRESPLAEYELDLERDKAPWRDDVAL
jgi:prevent-host-death family protein